MSVASTYPSTILGPLHHLLDFALHLGKKVRQSNRCIEHEELSVSLKRNQEKSNRKTVKLKFPNPRDAFLHSYQHSAISLLRTPSKYKTETSVMWQTGSKSTFKLSPPPCTHMLVYNPLCLSVKTVTISNQWNMIKGIKCLFTDYII